MGTGSDPTILPGTGRWQAEGLTEGELPQSYSVRKAPSTSLAGPPPLRREGKEKGPPDYERPFPSYFAFNAACAAARRAIGTR